MHATFFKGLRSNNDYGKGKGKGGALPSLYDLNMATESHVLLGLSKRGERLPTIRNQLGGYFILFI